MFILQNKQKVKSPLGSTSFIQIYHNQLEFQRNYASLILAETIHTNYKKEINGDQ